MLDFGHQGAKSQVRLTATSPAQEYRRSQPASAHSNLWVWEVVQGPGPVDPFHDDWHHWDAEFKPTLWPPFTFL